MDETEPVPDSGTANDWISSALPPTEELGSDVPERPREPPHWGKPLGLVVAGGLIGAIAVASFQSHAATTARPTSSNLQAGLNGTAGPNGQSAPGGGGFGGPGAFGTTGTISALTATGLTITSASGATTTYAVDGTTVIVRDGTQVALADLRTGEQAFVHARSGVAERIFVGVGQGPAGLATGQGNGQDDPQTGTARNT